MIGLLLLRKANLGQILIVRQKSRRRTDLPVEFPLTDGQGVTIIQERRRLPDRRKVKNDLHDQKITTMKKASN